MSHRKARQRGGDSPGRRFKIDQEMLPSEKFINALLKCLREKMNDQETDPEPRPTCWQRMLRALPAFATAAVVLIAVGVLAFFGNLRTDSADFSEMLRHIRQASSVIYTVSMQIPESPRETIRVYQNNVGQDRLEYSDGRIQIRDASQKKCLILFPSKQQATWIHFTAQPAYAVSLNTLRQLAASAGQYIGEEEYQGQVVSVYQAHCENGVMTIWVDPRRQLPSRMEYQLTPSNNNGKTTYTLDNFQWNIPISTSAFSKDVPEGYAVNRL
jgi:hypothetical protein